MAEEKNHLDESHDHDSDDSKHAAEHKDHKEMKNKAMSLL